MKKYIPTLFLCLAVITAAQAQRKDTTVLSVYNNNQRFMLYPMPFGKNKPDKDFTAEMVIALDTINVLETNTRRDTSGKFPKRWITTRKCGKLPINIKDKVALMHLNTACDISTQVLNAQDAGALAVIIIHTTNSTDSVILPKLTGRERYADENKVKIPCFTVRKVIGEKLTGMLPSLVGIKRPDSIIAIQTLTQLLPTDSTKLLQQGLVKTSGNGEHGTVSDVNNAASTNGITFRSTIGWEIAPNPVSNEVTIQYNFQEAHPLSIEVFNDIGQLVTNFQLPATQTGKLDINVSAWQNGTYYVSLTSGKVKQVKRLVVLH
jgi:Secretion system C-terminal sorting domain/PA domain